MKKAPLITIEGGDGAGKTSLLEFFLEKLALKNIAAYATREPGGTLLGEKIRSILLTTDIPLGKKAELALFLAARCQQLEEIISPKLRKGVVVLCDRFHDSSIAYQGVARGLGADFVEKLCMDFTQNCTPDLTFYLDISAEKAKARGKKSQDRIEAEQLVFHKNVRQAYRNLAAKYPERICTLQAELPMQQLHAQAWQKLETFLERKHCVR